MTSRGTQKRGKRSEVPGSWRSGRFFQPQEITNGAPLFQRLQCLDELPKSLREYFRPAPQVIRESGSGDIMPGEISPTLPKLLVHQAANVMEMNCLDRFQKLVSGMEETSLVFG